MVASSDPNKRDASTDQVNLPLGEIDCRSLRRSIVTAVCARAS